jgi:ATP-dependent Lon protease
MQRVGWDACDGRIFALMGPPGLGKSAGNIQVHVPDETLLRLVVAARVTVFPVLIMTLLVHDHRPVVMVVGNRTVQHHDQDGKEEKR